MLGWLTVAVFADAEALAAVELFADWAGTEVDRWMGMGCVSPVGLTLAVASTKVCSSVVRGFTRVNGEPGLEAEFLPKNSPLKILAVLTSLGVGDRPSTAAKADADSSACASASVRARARASVLSDGRGVISCWGSGGGVRVSGKSSR